MLMELISGTLRHLFSMGARQKPFDPHPRNDGQLTSLDLHRPTVTYMPDMNLVARWMGLLSFDHLLRGCGNNQ